MDRSTEINLVQRIFDYLDTRSTTMMDSVHREPVTGYASRQQARLERQQLFTDLVFPNTVLVMASDHLESWRIFPSGESADESVLEASLYTPEPAGTEAARSEWDRRFAKMLGTVNDEDFPVVEDVQRGLAAHAQAFLTFGRHEPALAHFHRAIARELRVEAEEAI
jgi:hypothetical protein